MGMIYLVRKKLFQTKEGAKQLYYAVQRTLQPRGGVTEDILAKRIAHRTGRSEGDVKGILADLPHFIEEALKNGESVSIKGLGSFHIAITSEGFEHPEDVMPGTVRISRVYFTADRGLTTLEIGLTRELSREMRFFRYPLSKYFPASMLSKKVVEAEKKAELQGEFPEEEITENP